MNFIEPIVEQNYLTAQKVLSEILTESRTAAENQEQFKAALEVQKHFAVMKGLETQRRGQNVRIIERMTTSPEEYAAFVASAIPAFEIPKRPFQPTKEK